MLCIRSHTLYQNTLNSLFCKYVCLCVIPISPFQSHTFSTCACVYEHPQLLSQSNRNFFFSELVFVFLSVHTSSTLLHAPLICCSIISPALSQNYDPKMMFTFLGCCHVDKISTLFLLSQSILTHCGPLSCWYADLVSRSSQPSSSLSYLSVCHHHHMYFSVHHHHHHHHNYPCPLCMPVTPEC